MKTYMGIPGDPPVVNVLGPDAHPLEGKFGWGKSVDGGALAKAILVEHLGSEEEASKYYRRFLWRTIAGWDQAKPWTLTTPEIETALAEIRETEKGSEAYRQRIARERPPVADERGPGAGGMPVSPIRIKS